jgi:hypothetical protein
MNGVNQLLTSEQELVPSSGFATAVMDHVRDVAEAPPLPFPWKRFAAGLCASLAVAGTVLAFLLSAASRPAPVAAASADALRAVVHAAAGGLLTVAMVRGCSLLSRR